MLFEYNVDVQPRLTILAIALFLAALYLFIVVHRASNLSLRSQVVTGIQSGKIVPRAGGVGNLPPTLKNASVYAVVYITQKPGGATLILFNQWVGKGSNLQGKLFWPNAPSPLPQTVEITGPYIPINPGDPTSGPIDVVIENADGPNWYDVSFSGN